MKWQRINNQMILHIIYSILMILVTIHRAPKKEILISSQSIYYSMYVCRDIVDFINDLQCCNETMKKINPIRNEKERKGTKSIGYRKIKTGLERFKKKKTSSIIITT